MTATLAVSSSTEHPAPRFARTAQAAHLLSRVLRHMDQPTGSGGPSAELWYLEGLQLHPIVQAFGAALALEFDDEQLRRLPGGCGSPQIHHAWSLFSAAAICYSAQLVLYDTHTCAERDDPDGVGIPAQLSMQRVALEGMKTACEAVHAFALRIAATIEERKANGGGGAAAVVSPFVAHCLYVAAKNYCWYVRETGRVELRQIVIDIVALLREIGATWAVASE